MLDGLRSKFNVSVAELDRLDSRSFSTIGAACVSNDKAFVNQSLETVMSRVRSDPRIVALDYTIEFL